MEKVPADRCESKEEIGECSSIRSPSSGASDSENPRGSLASRGGLSGEIQAVLESDEIAHGDFLRLLNELHIHQVELELQNEELGRAQRELFEMRAKFQHLYDFAPVGYLTFTDDDLVTEANQVLCEMLGVSRNQLIGHRVSTHLEPEDQDTHYLARKALFADHEPRVWEQRMRTTNGESFWARFEATIVDQPETGVVGHVTISDISAEVLGREEKRALREQLIQSQKMEALGTLAGGVAHDFNNLLQAMLSLLESARMRPDETTNESCLAELQALVQRGSILTRQLLFYSAKGLSGRTVFDLTESIRVQTEMLRRLIPDNIELVVECPEEPLLIEGEPEKLAQAIVNLLINARDAMPDGGELSLRARAADGFVVLEVGDTGCGISEADRARIFEPFFTTKPKEHGTGLGLAVVWGIVQELGGSIEIDTGLGRGSVFRISIPTSEEELAPAAPTTDVQLRRGRGERVLLVEDQASARRFLVRMLETLGYRVVSVADAETALEEASDREFDILLTDYQLPGIDGLELIGRLSDEAPELGIVLMSGHADEHLTRALVGNDALLFLHKPFGSTELAHSLRASLAAVRMSRA